MVNVTAALAVGPEALRIKNASSASHLGREWLVFMSVIVYEFPIRPNYFFVFVGCVGIGTVAGT
jgi:hypothetical protein